jgi:pimeloyl-ACP methyl ester carboxylesterase
MKPVAEYMFCRQGVIEALQTRHSIDNLLDELHGIIREHGHSPVALIGHSWGAWLSLLFASRYPQQTRKIILVGTAPLMEKHVTKIMETRYQRLEEKEAAALSRLMSLINTAPREDRDPIFLDIAELIRKADAFHPETISYKRKKFDYKSFEAVWPQAEKMRSSGALLKHAGRISCPVLAIHGDYDPHPYAGVKFPLEKVVKNFRFLLLEKCGHEPWNEIHAKQAFYDILEREI